MMMENEMRDRLYELLCESEEKYSAYYEDFIKKLNKAETQADYEKIYDGVIKKFDFFTDHLISNGVIVPLCNIGDTVYVVCEDDEGNFISENKITEVCTQGFFVSCYDPPKDDMGGFEFYKEIGKSVFLTKEQAEQKLKEMECKKSEYT